MNRVLYGDCRDSMRALHADGVRVQMCVTSPPYFGLRDYGVPPTHWPAISYRTLGGVIDVPAMDCCLGLEATPEAFIGHLVEVFRCVRDLLADDGVCWVNIGDSYAGSDKGAWANKNGGQKEVYIPDPDSPQCKIPKVPDGMKPKDLIGIPWMLAFALRADGWYLRQGIIWSKPNPMPESVTDRCTKAHEDVFLLAKSERYYFEHKAIKEPAAPSSLARWQQDVDGQAGSLRVPGKTNGPMKAVGGRRSARDSFKGENSKRAEVIPGQSVGTHRPDRDESAYDTETRNKRSVWEVATVPYKGAHFATYPPKLIEPCILAGSRAGDIVLDPFFGSGTTGEVCERLGRRWIGCELQEAYAPLHAERTGRPGLELCA